LKILKILKILIQCPPRQSTGSDLIKAHKAALGNYRTVREDKSGIPASTPDVASEQDIKDIRKIAQAAKTTRDIEEAAKEP